MKPTSKLNNTGKEGFVRQFEIFNDFSNLQDNSRN